jgi:hypothetical protein
MILVADVLKAVSDDKSLELFKIVALAKQDSDILISKTRLSRKKYYSRMSKLIKAGLIKRINGKHTLTAFGKVIYYLALTTIENASSNYWRLKVIDSLEMSNDLPAAERQKLIDDLIDNQEIKTVLVSNNNKLGVFSIFASATQQQRTGKKKKKLEK